MGSSKAIVPVCPTTPSSPSSSSSSLACSQVSCAVAYDSPRVASHGVLGPVWYSDSDVLGRDVRAVASDALVSDVLGRRRLAGVVGDGDGGDAARPFPFPRGVPAVAVTAAVVAVDGAAVAGEEWSRRRGIGIGSDGTDETDVSIRRLSLAPSSCDGASNSRPLPVVVVVVGQGELCAASEGAAAAEKLGRRLE